MKRNSFNPKTKGSRPRPPSKDSAERGPQRGSQQKPQDRPSKSFDGSQRNKTEKLQYPRSWRQIAGTHAIFELLNTRPKSVEVVLVQINWKSSSDLRELVDRLQAKKIKIEEKSEAQLHEFCKSHQ